jgi:hypothetical protein
MLIRNLANAHSMNSSRVFFALLLTCCILPGANGAAAEPEVETFTSLICTSVELEKFHERERYSALLFAVGQVSSLFPQDKEAEKRFQKLLASLKAEHEDAMKGWDKLATEISIDEELFHYRLIKDKNEEGGLVIMRGKVIQKRYPHFSSTHP